MYVHIHICMFLGFKPETTKARAWAYQVDLLVTIHYNFERRTPQCRKYTSSSEDCPWMATVCSVILAYIVLCDARFYHAIQCHIL